MTQKDNILQELQALNSRLAESGRVNVYEVPAGYFDDLAGRVMRRIRAMEAGSGAEELSYLSPTLRALPKEMPYKVPAGYFDMLPGNLLHAIQDHGSVHEELETLSPLLGGLNKETPYAVPQGYFDRMQVKQQAPSTKVISLTGRRWFRYAAAAVITGMVVLAGLLIFDKEAKPAGGKALAKFTRDIKKMDDRQKDKLIDFIDGALNEDDGMVAASPGRKNEVKELLQGISAEELNDFQQQTDDIEDVLMIN